MNIAQYIEVTYSLLLWEKIIEPTFSVNKTLEEVSNQKDVTLLLLK